MSYRELTYLGKRSLLWRQDTRNLAEWQAEAKESHPPLEGDQARAAATRSAVGAVRLWDDPMLGTGLES